MVKKSILLFLLLPAAPILAQTDQLSVVVGPDTVRFMDGGAWENCAARFRIGIMVNGPDVTLTETDTVGPKMRCMCTFDLRAAMTGLAAGTYTATWYRDYRKAFGYGSDALVRIGSVPFEIAGGGGSPALADAEQSPCYNPTEVAELPRGETALEFSAYPNPIDASRQDLILRFDYPAPGPIRIELFNLLGKRMFLLERDYVPSGKQEYRILGSFLPRTGIYFLVVTGDSYRRMLPILCGGQGGGVPSPQGISPE